MSEGLAAPRSSCGGRRCALLVLLVLLASNLACGTGGLSARRNNDIRRVVAAYELAQRGPADELLVAFGFMEVRANLGFISGNTVWLQPVAEAEYFEARVPSLSYIFLHRPAVDGNTATVVVDRAGSTTNHSYRLTVQRIEGEWSVVEEVVLE